MFIPQSGSDNPRNNAIIGVKNPIRNCISVFVFCPNDFAELKRPNQLTILGLNKSGARLIASVPPANTKFARPVAISLTAQSNDCKPDAQLRCTVHAGT